MYSFSYLEPVCCSMSSSNCCFLTCIQIYQEAGQVVWYSHLFQYFPQFIVIHTVKGFGYNFSSSHVWMWELVHKKGWVPKNWCFWTVVLEKTLESPSDCKGIKPANPKGNQPWTFIGRTDAEAQYFDQVMQRADSLEKTLMLGKIEGRKTRGRLRVQWLDGITDSMNMNLSKLQDIMQDRKAWHAAAYGFTRSWTWFS